MPADNPPGRRAFLTTGPSPITRPLAWCAPGAGHRTGGAGLRDRLLQRACRRRPISHRQEVAFIFVADIAIKLHATATPGGAFALSVAASRSSARAYLARLLPRREGQ
ncbi:hypothetical protein ACPA9J_05525 [Pseudomonas aeruginosa]